ncbi:MAG: PH domain-containing protein, partial [Myxococcota bacterium]
MPEAEVPADAGRLHPAAAVQGALAQLRQMAVLLVVLLVRGAQADESYFELITVGVAVPLLLMAGIVRWVRFRYWFTQSGVEAIDGAFVRRRVSIPFDRVRAVEENEGIVHQLFGVSRLQIKTGATGTQLDLSALDRDTAARIRAYLLAKVDAPSASSVERRADEVQRLRGIELLWVGLTTRGGIAGAVLASWTYPSVANVLGVDQPGGLLLVFTLTTLA